MPAYRQWLNLSAHLWQYSVRNRALIQFQRPGARWVAGGKQWAARGRTLKDGVAPIWILAPGGGGGFVGVRVYDLEDTKGPLAPLPSWVSEGKTRRLAAIEAAAKRLGVTVRDVDRVPGAQACCLEGRRVEIDRHLPPRERMATLIHEYAHALLHEKPAGPFGVSFSEARREAEAESVAYIVMRAMGERPRSAHYLGFVGSTPEQILGSTTRISDAARIILKAVTRGPRSERGRS